MRAPVRDGVRSVDAPQLDAVRRSLHAALVDLGGALQATVPHLVIRIPLPVAVAQRELGKQAVEAAPDGVNVVLLLHLGLLGEVGHERRRRHACLVALRPASYSGSCRQSRDPGLAEQ